MKKSILWVAAGMMTLAACQKQAGYTIQGTVEGVADGDTVYLQNFENNNLVKIDSAIVKTVPLNSKVRPTQSSRAAM